jgi:hypothetical protein
VTEPRRFVRHDHPDAEIVQAETPFERYLRVDTFRFRHRLFSGNWSAVRSYDVLRRGQAVAISIRITTASSLSSSSASPRCSRGARPGRSRRLPG